MVAALTLGVLYLLMLFVNKIKLFFIGYEETKTVAQWDWDSNPDSVSIFDLTNVLQRLVEQIARCFSI